MKILGPVDHERHKEFITLIVSGGEFFSILSPEQLGNLLYFIKFVEFDKGETIFEKNDPGNAFYIIYTGKVEARAPAESGQKTVSVMGPKSFFGELALILKLPRTAGAVCVEPTQCFRLDSEDFERLLDKYPDIAVLIRDIAEKRYQNYH